MEMNLDDAVDVAAHPNGPDAVYRLRQDLTDQRALVREGREDVTDPTGAQAPENVLLPQQGRRQGMSIEMLRTATDGTWNRQRYNSPSEARQAVLVSAAGGGLSLTEVKRRLADGTWPGMAQFYSRYSPAHRHAALGRDWREAVRFAGSQPPRRGDSTVRKTNTSQPPTQGGAPSDYQYVRTWLNALNAAEPRYGNDRRGLMKRMLLRAVAEACLKTGQRSVSFGVRSLAVAVGTDAGTVSRHLKELSSEHSPLLKLVSRGHGVEADAYELVIPQHLLESATSRSWRKGKVHGLRPAFRELGVPEALVYEVLERADSPIAAKDLVANTGLSRTAVNDALMVLGSWRLATGLGGHWVLSPTADLDAVAERLGCTELVCRQLARYRMERESWHAWLKARAAAKAAGYLDDLEYASVLWELVEPPPDPWESTQPCYRELGPLPR
ncbi:MarR family transcriptional regulator (plasmid) [Citricoccus nitrophenolicus]